MDARERCDRAGTTVLPGRTHFDEGRLAGRSRRTLAFGAHPRPGWQPPSMSRLSAIEGNRGARIVRFET